MAALHLEARGRAEGNRDWRGGGLAVYTCVYTGMKPPMYYTSTLHVLHWSEATHVLHYMYYTGRKPVMYYTTCTTLAGSHPCTLA